MNFKGKTAVIAGNAWGLGHATALMFAREGAQVICIDDNAETKDVRLLRMDEFELPYFHADVSDAGEVQADRLLGGRWHRASIARMVAV